MKNHLVERGVILAQMLIHHIVGDFKHILVDIGTVVIHRNTQLFTCAYSELKVINTRKCVDRKPRESRRGKPESRKNRQEGY